MAAASQTGITVSGNYNQMSDSASISQDTFSTTTQTSTSTSTITETVSRSETNIADSYNADNSITDSYNSSDSSVTDNSTVDNSTNSTTNDNSLVTYEGQEFTLPNLLSYLQGTGLAYSLTLGDTVYTIDGEGDPAEIDCGGDPVFSPAPPLPVECSGG